MFQRTISENDVRSVLIEGKTIPEYPDDKPYPSRLVLGWRGNRPLHVVAAENAIENQLIVITAYEPDLAHWEEGFEKRTKR